MPIEIGAITAAIKRSGGDPSPVPRYAAAVMSMTALNDRTAMAARAFGAHPATDVKGFGLLGHADRLADASLESRIA